MAKGLGGRRHTLAPETEELFRAFSKVVFVEGALDTRTKQLIAVPEAHVIQYPWCIEGHVKVAKREGPRANRLRRSSGLRPKCTPG